MNIKREPLKVFISKLPLLVFMQLATDAKIKSKLLVLKKLCALKLNENVRQSTQRGAPQSFANGHWWVASAETQGGPQVPMCGAGFVCEGGCAPGLIYDSSVSNKSSLRLNTHVYTYTFAHPHIIHTKRCGRERLYIKHELAIKKHYASIKCARCSIFALINGTEYLME